MSIDKEKLKALAEVFPSDLDWDSNTEPFFNGPSGESLGGGSTGFYSVYGQPFTIDGEEYDGTEYVSICTREFAEFVCSARSGVLALLAEIERLDRESQNLSNQLGHCDRERRAFRAERDQLKAENDALREDLALAKQAPLYSTRQDAKRYRWLRDEDYLHNWADVHVCDEHRRAEIVNRTIDAAMAKEASHG